MCGQDFCGSERHRGLLNASHFYISFCGGLCGSAAVITACVAVFIVFSIEVDDLLCNTTSRASLRLTARGLPHCLMSCCFLKYEYVRAGSLPQFKTWLSGHGQPEAGLNDITPGSNTGCNILLSLNGYPVYSAVQIPLADSGLNASPHFVIFQETLTRT